MNKNLDQLSVTVGQRITALNDFERHEPTYWEVMRYGQSPEGVNEVCRLALHSVALGPVKVDVLGSPLERTEIANKLLQLMPIDEDGVADPLPPAGTGTSGATPPGSDDSTTSPTPGS